MLRLNNKKRQWVRTKGKTRYTTREYVNPFFAKQKKAGRKSKTLAKLSKRLKHIFLIILLIIVTLVWFLFYSKYFSIDSIVINGQGKIDSKRVEKIINTQINNSYFIILPQKNLFLFNTDRLINNLKTKYAFDSIIIKKKLPNRLTVTYEEKTYAFIYQEGNKYYYADIQGQIIKEINLPEIEEKDYAIIQNITNKKIFDQQINIDAGLIDYAIELFNKLKEFSAEFAVNRIIIDDEINTVKVQLTKGPMIYFNTREDLKKQINKLQVIKNEKLKNNFGQRTYIDIRYGDSVYYR